MRSILALRKFLSRENKISSCESLYKMAFFQHLIFLITLRNFRETSLTISVFSTGTIYEGTTNIQLSTIAKNVKEFEP